MSKRIEYIDNAKGVLILMVVLGHVFTSGYVHDFIYTFHMPAFFIISGMLFNFSSSLNKTFFKSVFLKAYALLIPFLVFEIIGSVVYIIRFGFTQSPIGFIYNALTFNFNNGVDWFLIIMFCSSVLFILIHKNIKNKYVLIFISVTLSVVSIILGNTILSRILICYGFIAFGYYAIALFKKRNFLLFLLSLIATIILTFVNQTIDLNEWQLNNPLLFAIGAVSGTYFALYLCSFKNKLNKILKYFGKNSLIIMGTHQQILILLHHFSGIDTFSIFTGIIALVITLIIELPIIYVFNRFLPFLIGKKVPIRQRSKN